MNDWAHHATAILGKTELKQLSERNDAPGLLHRISRVVSEQGSDLDLALIATEGRKAIDVLHVTKAGRKLDEHERNALKHGLEAVLEVADETR